MLVITSCLMAAGTLFLALAATFQYLVTKEQAEITRSQLVTMRDQTKAMQSQLDSIQDQAASMREQTQTLKDSLEETKNVVRQNERVVKATEVQARTSTISAIAAQKTTHVAEESMILSSRPYVGFSHRLRRSLVSGQSVSLELILSNNGNSPAEITMEGDIRAGSYSDNETHFVGPFTLQELVLPGREKRLIFETIRTLFDDELAAINSGKSWLHFSAKGAYSGIGGRYPVSFCYAFDPAEARFISCALHTRNRKLGNP